MNLAHLVLAVLGGLAVWVGLIAIIGRFGWRRFADRYPAGAWPEGEGVALSRQTARIGGGRYSGMLHAVVTGEGLYLRPISLYVVQHPPMFLPWAEVERVTESPWRGSVRLQLPPGPVDLPGEFGELATRAVARYHALRVGTPGAAPERAQTPAG